MSIKTPIEWCDSSANPVMGCDGCELWQPAKPGMTPAEIRALVRTCYTGQMHAMRGGKVKGYARVFLEPEEFPGRMAEAARWRDLTGTDRPDKPWLNGLPRMVFISDMGDALSQRIGFPFLLDEVIRIVAGWRHVGMWLTKQPGRMAEFDAWLAAQGIEWPANLMAGTSITQHGQGARLRQLRKVRARHRFVSVEPIIDDPGELDFGGLSLAILGGESGAGARPTDINTVRALLPRIRAAGCSPFVKQLGSKPMATASASAISVDRRLPGGGRLQLKMATFESSTTLHLRDHKGGDMAEWPADLQVREFPTIFR